MAHAGARAMRKDVTRARLRRIDQQRGYRRCGRDLDSERLRGGGFQISDPKLCCRLILHFRRGACKYTSDSTPHNSAPEKVTQSAKPDLWTGPQCYYKMANSFIARQR
jgi:hypothetical protein